MKSEYTTTTSGQRLHYLQGGSDSGPLLICLHGLGGSTETFVPITAKLPPSYKIILLDFPGFGKSPAPSERPSVRSFVSDLHDVIAHLQGNHESDGSLKKVRNRCIYRTILDAIR
ncbi:Alpha/Beta hydrolase protein [Xylariaceae sp. FL0804]|nr:Alpha/Beta hydrolase protein [Xylariaceae sp. FL0804]